MDQKTQKKLVALNMRVAKRFSKELVKEEKPWEFENQIAEAIIRDPKTSPKERDMIKRAMAHPMMQRKHVTKKTINMETTAKMQKEIDREIQRMIRKGEIPPPEQDRSYWNFMRAMHGKKK